MPNAHAMNMMNFWADKHSNFTWSMPWIIGGDFNPILNSTQKYGGLQSDLGSMNDSQDCILGVGLSQIDFAGNKFTWCNNQRRQ